MVLSTILVGPAIMFIAYLALPESFDIGLKETPFLFRIGVLNWEAGLCSIFGLVSGVIIGLSTEYYTSYDYLPVNNIARASDSGPATNIISGLSYGYYSTIIPIGCLAVTIFASHVLAGMYGIALAALGTLSTLATALTIDGYGPISDNAGGIAEMSGLGNATRENTDILDAAGNTTAAIGKGFAVGSAALVAIALFGAFTTRAKIPDVNILGPV